MIRGRLTFIGTGVWCVLAASVHAEEPTLVRLNTVGYLPKQSKMASVVDGVGEFTVVRVADGVTVLAAPLGELKLNADTQERLATADFTSLATPGKYRLVVDGFGQSAKFRISSDVYRQPFRLACRGLYLSRCGVAVTGTHRGKTYHHEACHEDDAWLDIVDGVHERRPCAGGWHDAGDYNKYVVNAGVTVGSLLRAWADFAPQIQQVPLHLPEAKGNLPEFLAEVKWELDWLLTMQADDGSVYHKVSTKQYSGFVAPEHENLPRYLAPWGSAATADFVALAASAAKHYRPYEPQFVERCLQAATKSYKFLRDHPEYHKADQRELATGFYETHDWDDRLWAQAELWDATGDAELLKAFETTLSDNAQAAIADVDWDWGNVRNLALITYLSSQRAGRDEALVDKVRTGLIDAADQIVAASMTHGYGRPMGKKYYWGCNGTVARQAIVLEAARRLSGDQRYRAAQSAALSHLMGRNYFGRSFVTGLGDRPPMYPHDRRSGPDNVPGAWPGYLVGGAERNAKDWRDSRDDYRTNEIAINWNAALIYALASQLSD